MQQITDLTFDEYNSAKLYHPSNEYLDLYYHLRNDGKVEIHSNFEVSNDPMNGTEYEGTEDVVSYEEANKDWKEAQKIGYTTNPTSITKESSNKYIKEFREACEKLRIY